MSAPCRLVVCGFGYCGARIVRAWPGDVWATVRTAEAARNAEALGVLTARATFGAEGPPVIPVAPSAGVITFGTETSSPDAVSAAVTFLAASGCRRAIYLSSTSVYGDRGGGWVAAESSVAPDTEMGARRVAAEAQFSGACADRGIEADVLRLPGIVGPGRTPIGRVRAGTYVIPEGERWANRVHVDDVASAVALLAQRDGAGATYLASGEPFLTQDLAALLAAEAGAPPIRVVPFSELPRSAQPYWSGSRRCSAAALRSLGWVPRHAQMADAYRAAWSEERLGTG